MGTRADFYVGRGVNAEWLGSIAWDGYPDGIEDELNLAPASEQEWRDSVAKFIAGREDGTTPDMGWPWPWDNGELTDYSYAFDSDTVYGTCFGYGWWKVSEGEPEEREGGKTCIFPDMKAKSRLTMGKRSGIMLIGVNGPIDPDTLD